ncbi:MAG: TRAP transporter large permease [Pseudomonadales bacterium]
MTFFLLFVLLVGLLVLRQPMVVVLLVALMACYFFWGEGQYRFIALDAWNALNKEVLLSIPLYLLAGNLMAAGSMARRITNFLQELSCFVPGGLALAAVLACAVFAAMSGSSTVTLLAVGGVMYPALMEAGYSRSLVVGLLCAAGTLGIIVPPSIPLILYGVMTQVSIVDLFIAGLGPALLLTLLMSAYVIWRCRDMPTRRWSSELGRSFRASIWALGTPALIMGGIYSGYFTATEAAVVAVAYTLLVQVFVYREMGFSHVVEVAQDTSRLIGGLFPVLMLAVCLNLFLTLQQLPAEIVASLASWLEGPVSFLFATNILLLLVGSVVDIGSAILILAPLLNPLAANFDMHPVHFGIMMIVNLEIGYLTPPMGLNLIVAMGAFRIGFWDVCKAVIPFVVILLTGLFLVAAVPSISTFLI